MDKYLVISNWCGTQWDDVSRTKKEAEAERDRANAEAIDNDVPEVTFRIEIISKN